MRMVRCKICGQLFHLDDGHDCPDDSELADRDPDPKGTKGDMECHRRREER